MSGELIEERTSPVPVAPSAPRPRRIPRSDEPFSAVFDERIGAIDLSDLDPAAFPEPVVILAREVWQDRARAEYRSIQIMSRFLGELAGAGESPQILAAAIDRVEDEVRHTSHCVALTERLGGVALLPNPIELREPEVAERNGVGGRIVLAETEIGAVGTSQLDDAGVALFAVNVCAAEVFEGVEPEHGQLRRDVAQIVRNTRAALAAGRRETN